MIVEKFFEGFAACSFEQSLPLAMIESNLSAENINSQQKSQNAYNEDKEHDRGMVGQIP